MAKSAKGMDAVAEKVGTGTSPSARKPPSGKKVAVLRKKLRGVMAPKTPKAPEKGGKPGMTVMIAIGKPKNASEDAEKPMERGMDRGRRPMSTQDILARMDARIAEIEAKLAKYEEEDEESEDEESSEHATGMEGEED